MKPLFKTLVTLTLLALTAGCASTPNGQRQERIVVQAATMHLIEQAARPAEKAQHIVDAVTAAKTLLADTRTTVGTLRSALIQRVGERDLAPSEKLVALEAINTLADEVEAKVGKGYLSPEAIVTINTVLGWVSDAASFYVSH